MMRSIDYPVNVRSVIHPWVKLTALLLVTLWPLATSHELLESCGVIHVATQGDQDADHEAADGHVRLEYSQVPLKAPVLVSQPWLAEIGFVLVVTIPEGTVASRPLGHLSTAPPELRRTWQFTKRAALPARAPEFVA
jgi:hypothetical protein